MRSRMLATMISGGALLLLVLVAFATPVPYTIYSPGPTVDLLTKEKSGYVVRVAGHKTYRDTEGALRLLTVAPTGPDTPVTMPEVLMAWLRPSQDVYRYADIYAPEETNDQAEAESQMQMVSSQDTAVAAALRKLGYRIDTATQVLGITRGGPGDGALKVHDEVLAVDGTSVDDPDSVVKAVRAVRPGTKIELRIRRDGTVQTIPVTTEKSEQNPKWSAIQVNVGVGYRFPFQVDLRLDGNIGGPSAGMMFAITVYDALTPGSLTRGKDIAGTGEIDPQGRVGGIGGIPQKLAAAQAAGAELFLAPAANCDEVRGGPYDPDKMTVVKVTTLDQAIDDINAWTKDPDTKLPRC